MEQNVTTLNLSNLKINKLQNLGYNYCNQIEENLLRSLSINIEPSPQTKSALEIYEEELQNGCILSFNTELDRVLIDEITPKRITELAGFPGSGKTQICFQLCITVQVPKSLGGLEGEAIYINTNKNFASHRLQELTKNFLTQLNTHKTSANNFTEHDILKHVYVFNCDNFSELSAYVKYLEKFLKDKQVRLIIIDSISNPLREVNPQNRMVSAYKLLGDLQSLAELHKFAIVVTNDFTTRIVDNEAYYTPSFGDSFFHRVNSRICLSKQNNVFCAELVKSIIKESTKVLFGMF